MFGIRTYVMLTSITVAGAILFGGYKFVTNMQDTIELQTNTIAQQQSALATTNETLNKFKKSLERQAALNAELNKALKEAEVYVNSIRSKLIRHDLETLAEQKPGLIEKRINDGTKKVFDNLERITSTD
jgi:septal ring factor EnvC (AmiA/AmiB activator)